MKTWILFVFIYSWYLTGCWILKLQFVVFETEESANMIYSLAFFLNFQKIFGIKNFKIFVTGESYAGRYVPYISAAMLDQKDPHYFNVSGRTCISTNTTPCWIRNYRSSCIWPMHWILYICTTRGCSRSIWFVYPNMVSSLLKIQVIAHLWITPHPYYWHRADLAS